jgi:acetyl esterase/lipase
MTSTKNLLHPELQVIAEAPMIPDLSDESLSGIRNMMDVARMPLADPDSFGVERTDIYLPQEGRPDIRCLLYVPKNREKDSGPAYLHIHGGGYVIGSPDGSDAENLLLASKIGVVILSVDYRLAPECPIPGPIDDCYEALAWLHNNAEDLNIDQDRIGIGGESAGGGLAASLAIRARDSGEYKVCWQSLTYPMLDDKTGSDENQGDPLVGEFVWTREFNQYAWDCYLGDAERIAPQVPARLENFEGLPPAWMFTVTLDLFRDENIDYAKKLMMAGVSCDLVVYPGACHAFQQIEESELAKRYRIDFTTALKRGLGG